MQYKYTSKDVERFWSKVEKSNDPNACWIWMATKLPDGYGQIRWEKKLHRAHRLSYELTFGKIPLGLCVCHKCDNPSCCNPNHLFLGTYQDNIKDMINKGRGHDHHGEKSPVHKLTNSQVAEIRHRYLTEKISQGDIAKIYKISQPHVCEIVNYKVRT